MTEFEKHFSSGYIRAGNRKLFRMEPSLHAGISITILLKNEEGERNSTNWKELLA